MKKLNQGGFHILPVLIAILVIGGVGFAGYRVMGNKDRQGPKNEVIQHKDGQSGGGSSFIDQYKGLCKEREVAFTHSPVPMDQLGHIEPLGKVSDGHITPTDHVYIAPKNFNAADNTTDVVMPADGTVVDVSAMPSQYIGDRQQQTAAEDHRLVISHNCRFFSIFIHVHKLSPALSQAVGRLDPNTSKRVSIELKAGDKLGKIGGNPVDWTSLDTSKKLAGFITPSLYQGESWKIHTISPYDLYKGDIKKQLEAKSLRSKVPIGGKIDYDQKGKLIGNWFRSGSGGYSGQQANNSGRYWDGHLSIAPDHIDGTTPVISIGNWEGKANQLTAKGNFDPTTVSAGSGPVKVELVMLSRNQNGPVIVKDSKVSTGGPSVGTIMFEVQPGEKLKLEKFPGKTAAQVAGFTANAQTYER